MRAVGKYLTLVIVSVFVVAVALQGSIPQVATGAWQPAGQMNQARTGATAVLLPDGRILIAGGTAPDGTVLSSAEFFNTDGTFSMAPPMSTSRSGQAAVWMPSGEVLVTGGTTSGGTATNSAEAFNPQTNTWQPLSATLVDARTGHTMVLLQSGDVLIVGGTGSAGPISALEIFSTTGQQFTFAGALATARTNAAAAILPSGSVLIAGGTGANGATLASSEIFDPANPGGTTPGPALTTPRSGASATTLLDGTVLIAGGSYPEGVTVTNPDGTTTQSGPAELASAEIFDPVARTMTAAKSAMSAARTGQLAFLLPSNNNVLLVGGTYDGQPLPSAELYSPWTGQFGATGTMASARAGAVGSALNSASYTVSGTDGRLLVAGGSNLSSAELYGFATIKTNATEYAPGTPVFMTGSGWKPNEKVTLYLHETPSVEPNPVLTTVADAFGNINDSAYAPDILDLGIRYYLTAVGATSGTQAQTTFADGTPTKLAITTITPASPTAGSAFSVTVQSEDSSGTATNVTADTTITLTLATGTGTLGGTLTGTITAGTSSVIISGATYTKAQTGVSLTATASGGNTMTAATSSTFKVVAGVVSPTVSTVVASPTSVTANGSTTSKVTVTLLDANSNPVSGKTVTLTPDGGSSTISAASGSSSATGVVTFKVTDTVAEAVTYTATDTTDTITITPTATVTFTAGKPSASLSTVVASPTSIVADGSTTSTITVTLLDANSNPVSGKTVTLTAGSGSLTISAASGPSSATGVVTFTVTDTKAQAVTYKAKDTSDGITIAQTATVTFTVGAVSPTVSTVVASPTSVTANNSKFSTVTVTLLDANSNPVSGKTVTLTAGSGSSTISAASGPSSATGVVTFTVRDLTAETVTYTATDTTDTIAITQTATVTFTVGVVGRTTSTVVASPTSVAADGSTTSTVTVTLLDAHSNPVSGKTVTLAQGSGSSTISAASGPSSATGVVTFTVKDTKAEAVTYTATDTTDSITLAQTAKVTFTAGAVSPTVSTVVATPTSVPANGSITLTITVTLLDTNGNPVSGKTVTLAQGSGSSIISAASGPSNVLGAVTFTVKDTKAEAVTYTATDTTDTITITQTATVTFIMVSPTLSTVVASPTSVVADGSTTSTVTVTLLDTNGNPVSGKVVTLTAGSGSSTISAASGPSSATGVVTFTVKDTKAETVTYTAKDATDTITIRQTATVTFTAGAVSPTVSTVVASPTSIVADGSTTSTVTVTLQDANSNPVSGKTVTLTPGAGSSTISAASGLSSATGVVTFTVKDTIAEAVTYTATDTSDSNLVVTQTATVTFTAVGTTLTLAVPSPASVTYGSNGPVTLSATLTGVTGVVGATVTFTVDGSSVGTAVTIAGGVASISTYNPSALAATSHSVQASFAQQTISGATYAAATSGTQTLTVKPAALTVTASSPTVNYGDPVPTITPIITGFVNGDGPAVVTTQPTCTTTYTSTTPAGSTPTTSCSGGTATNYTFTYVPGAVTVNPAPMKITAWPLHKPYGQTATLTGYTVYGLLNADTVTSVTLTSPGTAATAPVGQYLITPSAAQGTGLGNYSINYQGGTLYVDKLLSTITWATPSAISYGTPLGSSQLNATATCNGVDISAAGTFVYVPAAGTVLNVGSRPLSVTFTPGGTDSAICYSATGATTLVVTQVTPTITWATPAAIAYGTTLGGAQLNATATFDGKTVNGSFVYTPASGAILSAGTQTLSVVFTPLDASTYTSASGSTTLVVNQATPKITWTKPAAITYGTALSGTQLDATASVPGTFVYTPPLGTVLGGGTQTLSVTFMPTDTTDYVQATAATTITVNKTASTVTWATPAAISYGTPLGSGQLNATATCNGVDISAAGTFVYSQVAGTVLAGGSHPISVAFTPGAADSVNCTGATASVTLIVTQVTPTITWATPAAITYGTTLGGAQLNATATFNGKTVNGNFVYTPAPGTVLSVGTKTLSVVFTPVNTSTYTTASDSVTLVVNP